MECLKTCEKVLYIMHAKGISRSQLAKKLGVHYNTVHKWINEDSFPEDYFKRKSLAKALEVSMSELEPNSQVGSSEQSGQSLDPLTESEKTIIQLVRILKLSQEEAMRRLINTQPKF